MRTPNSHTTRLMAAIAGTTLALAITAGAPADDQKPADPKPDPSSVLRGPDVSDRNVPGAESSFGDSEMKPPQDRERPVLHRAFMTALRALEAEDTPADIRATTEQIEKVRDIDAEFRDAQRAHMDEHHQEMRDLMRQVRPRNDARPDDARPRERGRPGQRAEPGERRPGRGAPPDADAERAPRPPADGARPRARAPIDPESLTDQQRAALERIKEIRAAGPRPEAYHARIWDVLSAEQRGFVEARLAEIRERGGEFLRNRQRNDGPAARTTGEPRRERERRQDRDPRDARTDRTPGTGAARLPL